ncbi:helix-turn-helix domain-containing protein [Actinotalea sp.]|uniref:helix-turn-helix domain-containing protein n=1 Tax=Actinotalea sp. TaxID=1872145 RepID=UPI0035645462
MDSTTQQAVAQAIRVQRVRAGLSSEADLARRAGISPSALSKRLAGDIRMDLEDVDLLARALGLADGFALLDLARAERTTSAA